MPNSQCVSDMAQGRSSALVFASGILATGPVEGAMYRYEAAPPEMLHKCQA